MKKHLLASSALVAAGTLMSASASAATVKLGVGGYMEQLVGFVLDRNDAATNSTSVDQHTESEIHFKGSGKLDNGIQIIADVQLEVAGSPGNIIDEQYIIVRGSFGQLTLGSEDNAGHLMTIGYSGSWATGVGQSLTFDRADWITLPRSGGIPAGARFDGTLNDVRLRSLDNDSSKVSYFTPRFSGFQAGISYIPNFSQSTSTGGERPASKQGAYHEGWAVGANYNGKFDNVAIGVAVGYLTAASNGTQSVRTASTYKDTDDMVAYTLAAKADFGAIRVAAAVKVNDDVYSVSSGSSNANTTRSLSGTLFDIGARYRWGSSMASIGFSSGVMDAGLSTLEEEEKGLMLSYARNLGPGVKWSANLMYADFEDDVVAGTVNSTNEGWAATTGLRLSF